MTRVSRPHGNNALLLQFLAQPTWAASRSYLLTDGSALLRENEERLRSELQSMGAHAVFCELIKWSRERNIDEAYAELLAPSVMPWVSWELAVAISQAGDSSPRMLRLFPSNSEIAPVLALCKSLKAANVVTLWNAMEPRLEEAVAILATCEPDASRQALQYPVCRRNLRLQAELRMSLANALTSRGLVSAESEDEVISIYEEVVNDKDDLPPEVRGVAADMLGLAWKNRRSGNRRDNRRRAIRSMKQALEYFDPIANRRNWAAIQNHIGQAYRSSTELTKESDIEAAIRYFTEALAATKSEEYPEFCGSIHDSLAGCYVDRSDGDRIDNIKIALGHSKNALDLLTYVHSPVDRLGALSNFIDLTLSFAEEAIRRNYHLNDQEPKTDIRALLERLDELDAEAHRNVHFLRDHSVLRRRICERMGVLLNRWAREFEPARALSAKRWLLEARSASRNPENGGTNEPDLDRIESEILEASALAGPVAEEGGIDTLFDDAVMKARVSGDACRLGEALVVRAQMQIRAAPSNVQIGTPIEELKEGLRLLVGRITPESLSQILAFTIQIECHRGQRSVAERLEDSLAFVEELHHIQDLPAKTATDLLRSEALVQGYKAAWLKDLGALGRMWECYLQLEKEFALRIQPQMWAFIQASKAGTLAAFDGPPKEYVDEIALVANITNSILFSNAQFKLQQELLQSCSTLGISISEETKIWDEEQPELPHYYLAGRPDRDVFERAAEVLAQTRLVDGGISDG